METWVLMAKKTTNKRRKQNHNYKTFIIIGLCLLIAAVLILKNIPQEVQADAIDLPEVQLEQLLNAGQPVLAFFHSNTCYQCLRMTEIVDEVYPDFSASVALVDVDVYDQQNIPLLRRAKIQTIPTIILFDRAGQGQVYLGIMQPEHLRQQLSLISGK
jgi:thioredoxin-like negative regulator of GroEL